MTSFDTIFADRLAELSRLPPARDPATFSEIWSAEWAANGLDTTFGVGRPYMQAYDELASRTAELAGKPVPELARERGIDFFSLSQQGRVDALDTIIGTLPDAQQKWLVDYRDVAANARRKAGEIVRHADEIRAVNYGMSGNALGFLAGVARQAVDPVNLALAPLGPGRLAAGASKRAIAAWLGKEFAAGAATQAVQEPYIAARREELGLPNASFFEDVVQAGIGQAGISGMLRVAGAAYRALRASGRDAPAPLAAHDPADFTASADLAERNAVIDAAIGQTPATQAGLGAAARVLGEGAPLAGVAPRAAADGLRLDGLQKIFRDGAPPLEARYVVVERRDLIASHDLDGVANPDFPPELQPRDRRREGSRLQIADRAAVLQPELLGPSATGRDGAPVVGSDHVVESGNARVLMLEKAYRDHPDKAAAYRAYLDELGYDVAKFREPVLVRLRETPLTFEERRTYASEANAPAMAQLTATERATKDARALPPEVLDLHAAADIGALPNTTFVRAFADHVLTPEERNAFMTPGGGLSSEGEARIRGALIARAYGAERLIRAATEARGEGHRTMIDALADVAAPAARLRGAIEDGRVAADADVVSPLAAAFDLIDRARTSNVSVRDLLDQLDIERGVVPAATRAAVALFYRDEGMTLLAGRKTVAPRIEWAISQALLRQAGGFLDDAPDAAGLLRAARLAGSELTNIDLQREAGRLAQPARAAETPPPKPPEATPPPRAASVVESGPPAKPEPNLVRAGQLLDEAPGRDVVLRLDDGEASQNGVSARAHLDAIETRRRAAAELADCVDRNGGRLVMEGAA